ncbi:MAG TPA: S46 family peptidase [Gemmatimonadales bacterium]|nr:S46 family peptidase [Gemmatimonadales bacterium]
MTPLDAARRRALLGALWLAFAAPPAAAQGGAPGDTAVAGRFDLGRMWTFEYPPAAYFREAYGLAADSAWFARARLAALRIPGCSAAFVSPNGLIVTNHHCVRSAITAVSRPGEPLLDSGFVARTLEDERVVPGLYADQLVEAADVSAEVLARADAAPGPPEREAARQAAFADIQRRLRARHAAGGDSIWVQIVSLYNGGRYSAYVFRRFTNIRLVAAAELLVAFFGGDPDNFTYPRYDLDFAVLRAYGADGRPLASPHHFRWGADGVRPGEPVFVIGNPGATSRLTTMSQLQYHRDVEQPIFADFLSSRHDAMRRYREADPVAAEAFDVRNRMFSLANTMKVVGGRLTALASPVVMGRRAEAERRLRAAIERDATLRARFAGVFDALAALQAEKRNHAGETQAFNQLFNAAAGSAVLRRAVLAERSRAEPDSQGAWRQRLLAVPQVPKDLERRYLALQLRDIARGLGSNDPVVQSLLAGRSPEEVARAVVERSVLADSARAASAVAGGIPADDPGVALGRDLAPRYAAWARTMAPLLARERELAADLGRARFLVYGEAVPPDGTFSPRIADGVVQGYEYNGTEAPPYTTFYGMYDRFRSFGPGTDWDLPLRWRSPPPGLDLRTPLNFVSTADTYGGNSGSPAVTRDLALVGLNFDRNVEGLTRDYIFLPERQRNVMVDMRAVQAALEHVYDAHRIVQELLTGRLFRTEQEAGQAGRE